MAQKIIKKKSIPKIDLSGRELDVVNLIWDGYSTKEIAEKFDCSHRTIEVHISNVYTKINDIERLRNNNFVSMCKALLKLGVL